MNLVALSKLLTRWHVWRTNVAARAWGQAPAPTQTLMVTDTRGAGGMVVVMAVVHCGYCAVGGFT